MIPVEQLNQRNVDARRLLDWFRTARTAGRAEAVFDLASAVDLGLDFNAAIEAAEHLRNLGLIDRRTGTTYAMSFAGRAVCDDPVVAATFLPVPATRP